MATTVGELNVRLNLELQRLDAQINKANAKIARMGKSWHSEIGKAARAINATLATIGAGASISGLVAFGKQCIDLGGQIVDLSYQAGIGTDAFQNFRAAAMENGATGEQVADMFAKMRKAVQDAVDGNKTLNEAFDRLNLNAKALKSLAPETQFELVARAVSGAADKQAAYNAATDIFGAKIAPKMMQFIDAIANGGAEKAAAAIGKVRLTPEQLKTLDDAGDKLARIWDNIRLIGAHGIVGIFDAGSANDLAQIEARIKMLEKLKAEGAVTYTVNGDTADVEKALVNFRAARDRITGAGASEVKPDIEALEIQQAAAVEAARLEQINADVIKATAEANKQAEASMKDRAAADEKYFGAMRKQDVELNAIAEATRRMIDPSREYTAQIEDINRALAANKLRSEEAASAIDKIRAASVDAQLEDFFGSMDKKSAENMERIASEAERGKDAARELGMTFSSAFEDAIVDGKKLSDVLRGLAQDLVRLFLRKQVTEPLFASLFGGGSSGGSGLLGGIIGGMFADGGRPPLGKVSIVGEEGPELFVPDAAGAIISNRDIANSIEPSSSRGTNVSVVQNFAAGVSQSQLVEALRQTKAAAEAGVMSAISRRKGGFSSVALA